MTDRSDIYIYIWDKDQMPWRAPAGDEFHGSFYIRGRKEMRNKKRMFMAIFVMAIMGILTSPLSVFAL